MTYFIISYLFSLIFFLDRDLSFVLSGYNIKYFDIALLVIFIFTSFLISLWGKRLPTKCKSDTSLNQYMLTFFTVITLTSLLNYALVQSNGVYPIELKTLIIEIGYLWPIFTYWILENVVTTKNEIKFFFKMFILFSFASALNYYFNPIKDPVTLRTDDMATQRYLLSSLGNIFILAISMIMVDDNKKSFPLWMILLVISASSLIMSLQRTLITVSLIGFIFILLIVVKNKLITIQKAFTFFILFFICFVFIFNYLNETEFLLILHDNVISSFDNFGFAEDSDQFLSTAHRRIELKQYWAFFTESPVIGKGLGFEPVIFYLAAGSIIKFGFIHSSFMWLLTKTGIIGLILFLLIFKKFFNISYKSLKATNDRWLKGFMLGGIIFIFCNSLLSSLSQPVFEYKTEMALLGAWMGAVLAATKLESKNVK